MFQRSFIAIALAAGLSLPAGLCQPARAEEPVDWEMVTRIRNEGFHHSQVMDTVTHLADAIGPRLTGSPAMKEANEWTRDQLAEWGLENAHLHSFDFGRGWTFSYTSVHLTEPRAMPVLAVPKAWTPGTKGAKTGEVMKFKVESEEDFEKYKGKVKGKILLIEPDERRNFRSPSGRSFNIEDIPKRLDEEGLAEVSSFRIPTGDGPSWRQMVRKRRALQKKVNEFLEEEKALATIERSSRQHGVLRVGGGGSREKDESVGVTALVISHEHFTFLQRLLAKDETVKMEIEVKAQFHDLDDGKAFNTVAEIPGTGSEGEIVMAGAHLDSWHAGTGATDNGAASAVVMEAVRILAALDVKPKRTIRVALWGGEEQGLLGSRAYVKDNFAHPPEPPEGEEPDPFADPWPLTYLPDHDKLTAYFNLDNGGGRIRGIYAQENSGLRPIFEAWLEPFSDLEAETVAIGNTSSTDHVPFDRVGLPGHQFIQDPMDYFKRTHHTNLDVLDYVDEADLKQSAVILASFLYHAATRDERLPRKPLPRAPEGSEDGDGESSGLDHDHVH